jgi:hypothetical protein
MGMPKKSKTYMYLYSFLMNDVLFFSFFTVFTLSLTLSMLLSCLWEAWETRKYKKRDAKLRWDNGEARIEVGRDVVCVG